MTFCNGKYTGSKFARHESEPTSFGCFIARKGMESILSRKANDGHL